MHAKLTQRVDDLVNLGWEPRTTTETTACLTARRPFNWWLFLFVIIFFPGFGGILYLIFWFFTSRTTIFLHEEGGEVVSAGDTWIVQAQERQRERFVAQQRQIKERGFLVTMWPHLLMFLVFIMGWVLLLRFLARYY
jgi:hypothetical protein